MRARQLLIATLLLKWYISHGLDVTKINQTWNMTDRNVLKVSCAMSLMPAIKVMQIPLKLFWIGGDFQKSRSQHVLATESRGCQRDWRRKRVERYKKRECIPIPICHDTSGRLIIPQWYFKSSTWNIDRSKLGYPGKKPTLK